MLCLGYLHGRPAVEEGWVSGRVAVRRPLRVRQLCSDLVGGFGRRGEILHPSRSAAASGLLTLCLYRCCGCGLCVYALRLTFCWFADNLRIPRSLRRGGSNVRLFPWLLRRWEDISFVYARRSTLYARSWIVPSVPAVLSVHGIFC